MRVGIEAVGWWTPETSGRAAATAEPDGALLGRNQRRATLQTRMLADVVAQVGGQGLSWVVGSVGGELVQTFAVLPMGFEEPPASSPLRFGNSVHNTAVGLLSIATGNRAFASAVAAHSDAIAATVLIEAMARVIVHHEPVIAAWTEEAWPGLTFPPVAVALHLVPGDGARGGLSAPREGGRHRPIDPLTNPLAGALDLARGGPGVHALGGTWEVTWT